MTKATLDAVAQAADAVARSEHESAVALALQTGIEDGAEQGGAAEKARIASILRHESAANRLPVAMSLALDTDLSTEQAIKVLTASPEAAKRSVLDGKVPNPQVAADSPAPANTRADVSASWDRTFARLGAKV